MQPHNFVSSGNCIRGTEGKQTERYRNASLLAVAALCAGQQERFWDMIDAVFKAPSLSKNELSKLIVDIDQHKFETCLESSGQFSAMIERDVMKARELGLNGTPGFAIGRMDASGRLSVKTLITGARTFDTFQEAIDELP